MEPARANVGLNAYLGQHGHVAIRIGQAHSSIRLQPTRRQQLAQHRNLVSRVTPDLTEVAAQIFGLYDVIEQRLRTAAHNHLLNPARLNLRQGIVSIVKQLGVVRSDGSTFVYQTIKLVGAKLLRHTVRAVESQKIAVHAIAVLLQARRIKSEVSEDVANSDVVERLQVVEQAAIEIPNDQLGHYPLLPSHYCLRWQYNVLKNMPQDTDIKTMTQAQLRAEIMKLRKALRKHRDAKDNARCWHNDLTLYGALPEEKPAGKMIGDEKVFLKNCQRYIRRQQCFMSACPNFENCSSR